MKIRQVGFNKFKDLVKKQEGIVCLGCGGDLNEWVEGVTDLLNKEDIVKGKANKIWKAVYSLQTTGGRVDLAFVSKDCLNGFNVGKMAIWRLTFGECSWISDYLVNYAKHF